MYIREIHIQNVRGFEAMDLDLTRPDGSYAGWTVIAGRNGTGKSTLLKAIALSVAGVKMAGRLQKSFADWIRKGEDKAAVKTLLDTGLDEWLTGGPDERAPIWTALEWRRESGPEPLVDEASDVVSLMPGLNDAGPWSSNPSGWFIAGYGPFRRFGYRDDYQEPGPQMAARLESLFDEDATLSEAIHWLKDIHARQLDLQDRARRNPSLPVEIGLDDARALGNVRGSVLKLLDDDLLPPGARVADFDMSGLWIEQNGVRLALRNLSDGYRSAIALVFDIVRQMDRCFGNIEIEASGKSVIVPYPGVVLIDEIDAHLHIEWQKRVGFWLKEHFPNIQFIVTTHSPFICQAADARGLLRLPSPGTKERAEHVSEDTYNLVVNGSVEDAVMSELFGKERPYSDASEKLREEISRLESRQFEGKATKKDKARLQKLLARFPQGPSAQIERALQKLSAQLDAKTGAKR